MAQDFIRAHGEEQKAVRVDQIVEAALALYDEVGYDRLTFSKLAQGLGFSRINLYNYFRTKEELFLEIVRRAYDELVGDMLSELPGEPMDAERFSRAWCAVMARHPRAVELFVLMNMQVLRAVDDVRQGEFQAYLDSMVTALAERVALVRGLAPDEAWTLVAHLLNYAMGLWPIIARQSGYTPEAERAFLQRYAEFVALLLR